MEAPRLRPESAHRSSLQLCKGQREAQHLPKASSYICLAEALGLQFKSLFIDSYKGESELLTCLHSTKSIHIKGIAAEAPLPTQPRRPRAVGALSSHGQLEAARYHPRLEDGLYLEK